MPKEYRQDTIIKVLPGERFTPYSLAEKLHAKVVLESSSLNNGRERYSILLVDEAFKIVQSSGRSYMKKGNKLLEIKSQAKDILDVLNYFAEQHSPLKQNLPFPAGGLGFLSFEFCQYCDDIPLTNNPNPLNLPEAVFIFGHIFIIFDHYTDVIYLVGINYKESEINLTKAIDRTVDAINDLNFNYLAPKDNDFEVEVLTDSSVEEQYKANVSFIKDEIVKGNLLQCVPSRRLQVKTKLPALEAYRRLRSSNPSPYLFFFNFDDYQMFGSSPEVHVKVHEGKALIRPIAGTRRRGKTNQEDLLLEKELLDDPKERAEHLMLVDLARNDLGRLCEKETVQVTSYAQVERYSHVMHIVSNVEGLLKDNKNGMDAIRATFPAGTVSGAPKIQAIKTISQLESFERGFYAGLVGYFEPGGNLDTCIAIRTGLKQGDVITLQAGGGIVHDSEPERELEETNEKLRALASSIGIEV
ncbi:anthranilate synthase component I [Spirochaeta cellobiosiphila]|uniref:anthranilate synthase component I n=1 Tax=Spirochaeta cellobiosiphila TaxID=504483 RepID=UPI000403E30A|nr:anthranilate synthase component I [Spirochaeta cellobiosiphila]